jgi:NADH-quinone oxidoreductase subunit E
MADSQVERNEIFWSLVSWGAGILAGLVVGYAVAGVFGEPAAGIVFGGVTFVIAAWVLSRFLGPRADDAAPSLAAHVGHAGGGHAHAAPAAPVADPVAEPMPAKAPVAAPDPQGISERVRDAARAAGEAARAALGDASAPAFAGEESRPVALAGPREGAGDDLKKIKGVGPKLEEMLHGLGFYHFDQIAAWTAAEVAWVDSHLEGFNGRATRDDGVGQATILAAGGETEFSQRVDKGEVY